MEKQDEIKRRLGEIQKSLNIITMVVMFIGVTVLLIANHLDLLW